MHWVNKHFFILINPDMPIFWTLFGLFFGLSIILGSYFITHTVKYYAVLLSVIQCNFLSC